MRPTHMHTDDDPPPAFETDPPFSIDFLAHLQMDFYPDELADQVWPKVLADPDAVAILDELNDAIRLLKRIDDD